jgi:YD repeat-containing protein
MRSLLLATIFLLAPTVAAAQEVCGNGSDDNSNGLADEGCYNLISGQCESPLSCGETGSVSPKKGNLRYSLPPDIAPKVPWGPGIGFRRTYIAQFETAPGSVPWMRPMGDHWQHTYMTWIVGSSLQQPKVLHTSQGQEIRATFLGLLGDNWDYYGPQPGFHVVYFRQQHFAPNNYEIKLLTGDRLVYNSSGRLIEIWDTIGTKVTVTYDGNGQVSTVTDASGTRRLSFGYSNGSGLLKDLTFQTQPPTGGGWTSRHVTTFNYTESAVTQDATSKWFVPANATEWTNLLKGSGIANPSSLWLMQQTTGSLADTIGTRTATLTGSATYQVTASGWTRKGVKLADNSTSRFTHSVPTASTNSLAYVQVFSLNSVPGGARALNRIGVTQYEETEAIGITLQARSGGNVVTNGWIYGGTVIVVTKLDHSRNEFVMYTDQEMAKPTFVNQAADTTSFLLGNGINASDATLLYAGLFTGTGAEFSDAQAGALIKRIKAGTGLTSVTIGGQVAQQYTYGTDGLLSQVQDGGGNNIASFKYSSTTAGQVNLITTPRGTVGFEFASSRTNCQVPGLGQTVLYFNKGTTTSCNADTDCGAGYVCGGKTASTGSTGTCFRAARCLTVSSPNEDVVTSVAPIAASGDTCDGACAEIGGYVWRTSYNNGGVIVPTLDLQAVGDALGNYTSRELNNNGLPIHISYGDTDSDATTSGGARDEYLIYDTNFPGRVSEIRRQSNIDTGQCDLSTSTGCAITRYIYNSTTGTLDQLIREGLTLLADASPNRYTYTTLYSYLLDGTGRLSSIDGPLAGSNDQTVFEYFSSNDLKFGFLQNYKRKKDASTFIVTSAGDYDFWGNATTLVDTDGTVTSA